MDALRWTFTSAPSAGDASDASHPAEAAAAGAQGSAAARPLRVLIVEDNRDSADLLAMVLALAGHAVTTVYDGMAGADAATASHFHVIILDLSLPGIDGLEVARRIRRGEQRTPAPSPPLIVALTGWDREQDRLLSAAAGCDEHMLKPVSIDALLASLAEHGSKLPLAYG